MGEFAYTHTMIFTFIYFFYFLTFFFESKKIRLDAQSARCSPLVRIQQQQQNRQRNTPNKQEKKLCNKTFFVWLSINPVQRDR